MTPPQFVASRDFWTTTVLVVLSLVMVWLFLENRRLIREHELVQAETQAQLVRLCDTTTALDLALVLPELADTRAVLELLPAGPERARALRRRENLRVAHAELSSSTLCDRVR